MIYDIFTHIQA